MKPRIRVKMIGSKFGVVLSGSRKLASHGFKEMLIISTFTKDTAFDWINRLRGMKRSHLVKLLKTEARILS